MKITNKGDGFVSLVKINHNKVCGSLPKKVKTPCTQPSKKPALSWSFMWPFISNFWGLKYNISYFMLLCLREVIKAHNVILTLIWSAASAHLRYPTMDTSTSGPLIIVLYLQFDCVFDFISSKEHNIEFHAFFCIFWYKELKALILL